MHDYDYERSPLGRLTFALSALGAIGITVLRGMGWL